MRGMRKICIITIATTSVSSRKCIITAATRYAYAGGIIRVDDNKAYEVIKALIRLEDDVAHLSKEAISERVRAIRLMMLGIA